MSITVPLEEIDLLRAELSDQPEALAALTVLEDCEGNLEDAAISLAIQVGQEPNISEGWIDGFAKRWRATICQPELREPLEDGLTGDLLLKLKASTELPLKLVTLVAIYVTQTGLEPYCKPLEQKLM